MMQLWRHVVDLGGDAYAVCGTRVVKGCSTLRKCGIDDGNTIRVLHRLRGGANTNMDIPGQWQCRACGATRCLPARKLFFTRKIEGRSVSHIHTIACGGGVPTKDCYATHRWSRTTSAEEGVTPSKPGAQRLSRRDSTKALAAAHVSSVFHLLIHAHLISSRKSSGSSRTFASASKWRKVRASPDHRPPTSQATTTSRALP